MFRNPRCVCFQFQLTCWDSSKRLEDCTTMNSAVYEIFAWISCLIAVPTTMYSISPVFLLSYLLFLSTQPLRRLKNWNGRFPWNSSNSTSLHYVNDVLENGTEMEDSSHKKIWGQQRTRIRKLFAYLETLNQTRRAQLGHTTATAHQLFRVICWIIWRFWYTMHPSLGFEGAASCPIFKIVKMVAHDGEFSNAKTSSVTWRMPDDSEIYRFALFSGNIHIFFKQRGAGK